ncbi:MAG: phosphoenolpyruvate carboxylase, partial [Bdellovibrionales bacterium]|nr:phosphoenolpyruvate carboxylase [Bdellovibrionales bacterium]
WLNPKTNSESEFKKQQSSIELFLSGNKFVSQHLPKELRHLVRKTTSALGKAIYDLEGEAFFKKVENLREQLKKTRSKEKSKKILSLISKKIANEQKQELFKLAHAYSLQLEIINVCEAAYRTWRQRQKSMPQGVKNKLNLTYVLTAHPTEARSKEVVEVLTQLQKMLVDGIHNKFLFNDAAMATHMRMLWLQSLAKKQRPTVLDEAEYIYSIVFTPDILDFILCEKPGYELKLRTWVGGDKDGHPGVNKDIMKRCLEKSRNYLIDYTAQKLTKVINDLEKLTTSRSVSKSELTALNSFLNGLKRLRVISKGDGTRIKTWTVKYKSFLKRSSLFVREHEQIVLIN